MPMLPPAPTLPPLGLVRIAATADCASRFEVGIVVADADGQPPSRATLSLKNAGDTACSLLQMPDIAFEGRAGRKLEIGDVNPLRDADVGHGPAVPYLVVKPGETATSALAWDGEKAPGKHCATTAAATIRAAFTQHVPPYYFDKRFTPKVVVQMCAKAGRPIKFTRTFYKIDR